MEDTALSQPLDTSPDRLAARIAEHRRRAEAFLAAHRDRARHCEARLTENLRRMTEQLAAEREEALRGRQAVEADAAELERRRRELQEISDAVDAGRADWEAARAQATAAEASWAERFSRREEDLDRRLAELERRRAEIEAAEQEVARRRQQAELDGQQLASLREQLGARERELAEATAALAADRQFLAARRTQTAGQRRRLAKKLSADRAQQVRSLQAAERELAAAREEWERRHAELEHRNAELDARDASLARREEELDRQARAADTAETSNRSQTAALQQRCAELEAQLADSQQQLAAGTGGGEHAEHERRYQLALDDLREQRAANEKLEEELARLRAGAAVAHGSDWESQKRRILAALEAEGDDDSEPGREKRIQVEEIVNLTERAIGEKDREIRELQQLLENQSGNLGAMAVGAKALGEMIDSDVLIQEERAKLRQLQETFDEKLRNAEIEISIERAQIARDRAELEELRRSLADNTPAENPADAKTEKPVRGRWLSRMGLSEKNDPT